MNIPISSRYYKTDENGDVVLDYQEGRSPFVLISGWFWDDMDYRAGKSVRMCKMSNGYEVWRRIGIATNNGNYCHAYICLRDGYAARFLEKWNNVFARMGNWCGRQLVKSGAVKDGDVIPKWSLARFLFWLRVEAQI